MQMKKLVFLQQALDTKVLKVLALLASGGNKIQFGPGFVCTIDCCFNIDSLGAGEVCN